MSDTSGKQTTMSLAIAEKKPNRAGGCVGIFFQLFDWNRRLAKKKLFAKKLLPPVRGKRGCNNFKGDEKRPAAKLHLIADENSGGFPNMKKNGSQCSVNSKEKNEMKAPGLVARLMGLESMPAMQRDKQKKSSVPDGTCKERYVSCDSGVGRENLHIEKGSVRPQKIQKTGQFDRKVVSKFGSEAFQIKGVLSKSKKNHHPKLASPLKSPKIPSARSVSRTSRLIDAATKILEPGLQATSRSKNALTYSSSLRCPPNNVALTMGVISPESLKGPGYNVNVAKPLVRHNACKNCGSLVDDLDHKPNVEVESFVSSLPSNSDNASSHELERIKQKATIFSFPEQAKGDGFQRSWDCLGTLAAEDKLNTITSNCPSTVRKHVSKVTQPQFPLAIQQCKPQKDESLIVVFKHKKETQNPVQSERDRMPPFAKVTDPQTRRSLSTTSALSDAKNYITLNKNLSSESRPRVAARVDNAKVDMGRSSLKKQDDSLLLSKSPVRKRRTRSLNGQAESTAAASPSSGKQRDFKSDTINKKGFGLNFHTVESSCIKSRKMNQSINNKASGKKDNDVSFKFNSQPEHYKRVPVDAQKRRDQRENIVKPAFQLRNSAALENYGTTVSQSSIPISGDALGALLEQKLKELTCQEDDELAPGAQPKKSTAMILQELIAALTADQSMSDDGHKVSTILSSPAKSKMQQIAAPFPHDVNHFSPGSVLEASFSNDSCISSSFDDNSGQGLCSESMDVSCEQAQLLDHDADSLDTGALLSRGSKSRGEMQRKLFNQVSGILHCMGPARVGLAAVKMNHAEEVILNTELCLGHAFSHHLNGTTQPLIVSFLLDKLEAITTSTWSEYNVFMSLRDAKGGNRLRLFLFDYIVEFLDSKYGQCCNSRFKGCVTLSSCTTADMLLQEIIDDLRGWMSLCGMFNDDIIEWEMTKYLGKWTGNDTEEFETGIEVEKDILEMLVDEIAIELRQSKSSIVYL